MMLNWIDWLPLQTKNSLCRPLLIRARTAQSDPAFFSDAAAVRICDRLGLLRSKTDPPLTGLETHRVMARTLLYDQLIRQELKRRPNLLVINLGAALNTRFSRVDNGRMRWLDIDLPDVIHVRKLLIPAHERVTLIGRSVFDNTWSLLVGAEEPEQMVFLADGLLADYPEKDIRSLLDQLARSFPGSRLYCDVMSRFARHFKQPGPCAFYLDRVGDIQHLDYRISVEDSWPVGALYPERQKAGVRLMNRLPACRKMNQVLQLGFAGKQS